MTTEFPNSFTDPLYAKLDARTEQKLGLPTGLLSAIRLRGERSNNDQVSEDKARSPYQFIPATRKAIESKYGIDPLLSPENASEAAGLLLKEALARNRNDPALAVAEYHGGTDRSNWGPRTRSYVQRVVGRPVETSRAVSVDLPPAVAKSTFARVAERRAANQPDPQALSKVFEAYRAGQMTPQEVAEFEADVKGGALMLPRGMTLQGQVVQPQANMLPPAVITAYQQGQMTPQERAELEADVASGMAALPAGVTLAPGAPPVGVAAIPGAGGVVAPAPTTPPQAPPSMLGNMRIPGTGISIGNAEAALTLGTGMVGGALGMVGGAIGGLAGSVMSGDFGTPQGANNIERAAAEGAQALTYAPRTPEGQQRAGQIGEVLAQTIPVLPLTGELQAIGRAAQTAAPAAQVTAQAAGQSVSKAAKAVSADAAKAMSTVTGKVRAALGKSEPGQAAGGSVGAAGVEMATMRRERAAQLPVPVKLTKGQETRSFEQTRFERETAKDPAAGLPLRERFADQNERLLKNFDAFVDQTGAEAPTLRATGAAVDSALVSQYAADKAKVRVAYKAAEKAGEMEQPVTLTALVDHLNESAPDAATAPILDVARKRAVRLGVAMEGADGELVAAPVPLKIAETMRQAVQRATDYEPTNVRQATIIKGLIDESTDGLGGNLYRAARKERQRLAQNYENRAVVNKLITTKRGTTDRNVALEDVFSHAILDGSLDDVRNVRRVLQRAGNTGQQAWRELQGQTVNYLKAEATKNVARDVRGNEIVSAAGLDRAVKKLDADGKLDFVFGKRGAQQIRDVNDIAKDIYTVPPGSVNTSNTASVLMAALDMGISGSAGVPLPVLSGVRMLMNKLRERRLNEQVRGALGPIAPPAPPPRQVPVEPAF